MNVLFFADRSKTISNIECGSSVNNLPICLSHTHTLTLERTSTHTIRTWQFIRVYCSVCTMYIREPAVSSHTYRLRATPKNQGKSHIHRTAARRRKEKQKAKKEEWANEDEEQERGGGSEGEIAESKEPLDVNNSFTFGITLDDYTRIHLYSIGPHAHSTRRAHTHNAQWCRHLART